jgi:hypothetical protein
VNAVVRLFLCLVATCGLLAGALSAAPDWFAGTGLDVWRLPELQQGVERASRRGKELARVDEVLKRLVVGKYEVSKGLIEGRLCLSEAVTRFRALNEEAASRLRALLGEGPVSAAPRAHLAADAPEAAVVRDVLAVTRGTLETEYPGREEEVLARLDAELHVAAVEGRIR